MSAVFGLIAGSVYLVSCFRHKHGSFTMLDAMIVVAIMAAVTAGSAPILDAADESGKSAVLKQNLHLMRTQIELYTAEHDGTPPLLFKGAFPQMESHTNAKGVPGPRDDEHRYGPYLPGGVPLNPVTGSSLVEPIEAFPPPNTVGSGGWLYHQTSGQIAPQTLKAVEQGAESAKE